MGPGLCVAKFLRGQATLPNLEVTKLVSHLYKLMAFKRKMERQSSKTSRAYDVISRLGRWACPRLVLLVSMLLSIALLLVCDSISAQSSFNVAKFDRARVLTAANKYLTEEPMTITASKSPRSAGGLHDF